MTDSLLVSVLTNGATVAVVTWFLNSREARRRLRADYLRGQLEWLYGPLAFFTTANGKLLDQWRKVRQRGEQALGADAPIAWTDPDALKKHDKDLATLFKIEEAYILRVNENSDEIVKLLSSKYHLLDEEDQDICQHFVLHQSRLTLESVEDKRFMAQGSAWDPITIGDDRFYDPIKASYAKKKVELRTLTTGKARWKFWHQRS